MQAGGYHPHKKRKESKNEAKDNDIFSQRSREIHGNLQAKDARAQSGRGDAWLRGLQEQRRGIGYLYR
jgi:hypothetical protein